MSNNSNDLSLYIYCLFCDWKKNDCNITDLDLLEFVFKVYFGIFDFYKNILFMGCHCLQQSFL